MQFCKNTINFFNKTVALSRILYTLMTYEKKGRHDIHKDYNRKPTFNTRQDFISDSFTESCNNGSCDLRFSTDTLLSGYTMVV